MDVTIHHLRCFLAVTQTGTFRGAAGSLHLSVSSVSEQVAQLEKSTGRRLFDRTSKGAHPTAAAWELLPMAELATSTMQDIEQWSRRKPDERIRIGLMVSTPTISSLMAQAANEIPGARWEIRHLGFIYSTAALLRGEVDCIFIVDMELSLGSEVAAFPLWEEERVLVVSETHRLADQSSVSMDDIWGETIIGVERTKAASRWMNAVSSPDESAFLSDHETLRAGTKILGVTRTFEEILDMCAAGIGVNIAGASAQANYARSGLRFIPIDDIKPATFYLCVRPGQRSYELDSFIQLALRSATLPKQKYPADP